MRTFAGVCMAAVYSLAESVQLELATSTPPWFDYVDAVVDELVSGEFVSSGVAGRAPGGESWA